MKTFRRKLTEWELPLNCRSGLQKFLDVLSIFDNVEHYVLQVIFLLRDSIVFISKLSEQLCTFLSGIC